MIELIATAVLVPAALIAVSIGCFLGLRRVVPPWVAALLAPLLASLAGYLYVAVAMRFMPLDGPAFHFLVLLPPFELAFIPPLMVGLLVWAYLTRRGRRPA